MTICIVHVNCFDVGYQWCSFEESVGLTPLEPPFEVCLLKEELSASEAWTNASFAGYRLDGSVAVGVRWSPVGLVDEFNRAGVSFHFFVEAEGIALFELIWNVFVAFGEEAGALGDALAQIATTPDAQPALSKVLASLVARITDGSIPLLDIGGLPGPEHTAIGPLLAAAPLACVALARSSESRSGVLIAERPCTRLGTCVELSELDRDVRGRVVARRISSHVAPFTGPINQEQGERGEQIPSEVAWWAVAAIVSVIGLVVLALFGR